MRLSEAIREGAKKRPMARGSFFETRGQETRSCALGAAYEAVTGHSQGYGDIMEKLHEICPGLFDLSFSNLPESDFGLSLANVIATINDSGKYDREFIADWLESIGL